MIDTLTHALTIHQPYAWAVAAGHKPVENRTWRPPLEAVGKLIGIHASVKAHDFDACVAVTLAVRRGTDIPDGLPRGALIGVARLVGVCRAHPDGPDVGFQEQIGRGNVWSDLDPEDCALIAPWAKPGHVLWRFKEAVLLPEPIPMRGQQGLWRIPRCSAGACTQQGHHDCTPDTWALEQWRKARKTR